MAGNNKEMAETRPPKRIPDRPRDPSDDKRRFGIGWKLILAFGAIAGLTVLASVVTWFLFGNVRDNLTIIAERNLPEIVASFRLAEESAQLSASIPRMVAARNEGELDAEERSLGTRLEAIKSFTGRHRVHGDDPEKLVHDFERIGRDVRSHIDRLRDVVRENLSITRLREATALSLFSDHDDFIETVEIKVFGNDQRL